MRVSSLFRPATAGLSSYFPQWLVLLCSGSSIVAAATVSPVSLPSLDLEPLGRVALTGNFDAISLYAYTQQTEALPSTNGSQALLGTLPNGVLDVLAASDADILAMCPFTRQNGSFSGIIVGGNFTSLGGIGVNGLASFNPATNVVENISGLTGTVNALLCDQDTDSVYVGGSFQINNSTNAVIWTGNSGWSSLPFGGFDGPVNSIAKDNNGHIIFGGSFSGMGSQTSPKTKNSQVINLSTANITSDAQSSLSGFINPRNIICKTNTQEGSGNTWLLNDNSPGFWRADTAFGFRPTKLRLYNTNYQGRGTKSFRFQAQPSNGILNLTYADPSTGDRLYCDAECPLPPATTQPYTDFQFVNVIGITGFLLEISDWYGQGAGLDGLALFEDDIYCYAINDFNEPTCDGIPFPSTSTTTGLWIQTPSPSGVSSYLTTTVTNTNASKASVTFKADIKQSGNYSVAVYTPGCIQDNSCQSRGVVNVTGVFTSNGQGASLLQTTIYQTNDYDKYDVIYTGYIDASSASFRPEITISPLQVNGPTIVVADRVGFNFISSTGGLNGLFDYNPTSNTSSVDFATSNVDSIGNHLNEDAKINAIVSYGGAMYAAGNFSGHGLRNILSFTTGNASSLGRGGGLNSEVSSLLVVDDLLYVGGSFTDTVNGSTSGVQHVAIYSSTDESWSPLGGGVNGPVTTLVSFPVNMSADSTEVAIGVSGEFNQILAFGSNASFLVQGFAVWVPSQQNWLQNLAIDEVAYNGQLGASTSIGNETILAGTLTSDGIASNGVVSLVDSDGLVLQPFHVGIQTNNTSSSFAKRDSTQQELDGVLTGLFDTSDGRNLTILGGHFTSTGTNGSTIENLLFYNGSNSDAITGLGPGVNNTSVFKSLAIQNSILFAGGNVSGSVGPTSLGGFIAYDLSTAQYLSPHPPGLTGDSVTVNSISARPDSTEIYVGGIFQGAGELPCPSVCTFDTSSGQWSQPGASMSGTIFSLQWASNTQLVAAGEFTIENNQTRIATYDPTRQTWTSLDGADSSNIPGPVTAFGPASQDLSNFWVSGLSPDGSAYLVNYDGSNFHNVGDLFDLSTTIFSLQVLGLSQDHDSTPLLDQDQVLLITGQLMIPSFGAASAALYNGTNVTPFLLSATADGQAGIVSELITENQNTYTGSSKFQLSYR